MTAFSPEGMTLFGDPAQAAAHSPLLRDFLIPPFTVLDTRSGDWSTRKRAWIDLGIQSEVGRGGDLAYAGGSADDFRSFAADRRNPGGVTIDSASGRDPDYYRKKEAVEALLGRDLSIEEYERDHYDGYSGGDTGLSASGTSVFDPVLCELAYRWFAPSSGIVLDPFAGGSVRGVVAACLGLEYWGMELREEQVAANRVQWTDINGRLDETIDHDPLWFEGDSRTIVETMPDDLRADLIFTCPPYYDLEVYSDDPSDLSAMKDYPRFLAAYEQVIAASIELLRPNRFAVFVVGDVRDRKGIYRGLVKDTIDILTACGASYYNHAILVNPVGSLPVRVKRQFEASRKMGKTHQDLIVAYRGDPKMIKADFATAGEAST